MSKVLTRVALLATFLIVAPASVLADADTVYGGNRCRSSSDARRERDSVTGGSGRFSGYSYVYSNGSVYSYNSSFACPIDRRDPRAMKVEVELWFYKDFHDDLTCTLYAYNANGVTGSSLMDSHTVTSPGGQTRSEMRLSVDYNIANTGYLGLRCNGEYGSSRGVSIYGYRVTERR
jgi:hypothetical protein